MFENIAAIDIGTSSIKLATVRTGFKDFNLKSFSIEDIDPDSENYDDELKNALERIISDEDLKGYRILTNMPMEKEIIRNISFPFSDVEKIAEVITSEAEENIPFKLDDLVFDFQTMKSGKENEGRVLLAAVHKQKLYDFLEILSEKEIHPVNMGMEANALFECYRYFNTIEDESVIQIDIGHSKTIVNIIVDGNLLYTRAISNGMDEIHQTAKEVMKSKYSEAFTAVEDLNIDLTAFENNVQRGHYKSMGLSKQKLKKIFTSADETIKELIEQVLLTISAFYADFDDVTFNRILLSGGGSNLSGIGHMISRELEIPVVSLPFLDDYDEKKIRTQFPIAFGTILSFMNNKRNKVNFLKGEFTPDVAGSTRKIYYLAAGFGVLTVVVFIANLIISLILTSSTNQEYNKIIQKQYKKYFRAKTIPENPIAEANKLLKKERKELDKIDLLMSDTESVLDLLKDILVHFPKDDTFELRNLVINQRIVRMDGNIGTSKPMDDFKEKLNKSKIFDSVTLNIRSSRKDQIRFSMTIKKKIEKETKRKTKKKI